LTFGCTVSSGPPAPFSSSDRFAPDFPGPEEIDASPEADSWLFPDGENENGHPAGLPDDDAFPMDDAGDWDFPPGADAAWSDACGPDHLAEGDDHLAEGDAWPGLEPDQDAVPGSEPDQDDVCVVLCQARECGQVQGCVCGTCAAGKVCDGMHQCVDDPCPLACAGKQCGIVGAFYLGLSCDCGSCSDGLECDYWKYACIVPGRAP